MKYISMFLLAAGLMLACQSNTSQGGAEGEDAPAMTFPKDSVATDGSASFHGFRIEEGGAIPVVQLKDHVMQNGPAELKIEGDVEAVCQAKGCWMTMKLDEEETMRVTFKDYGFFVPKDASGKKSVLEGRVFTDTVSVEERRHYAVDGGMSEEEAAQTITEPEISLAFEATGVIIKN